MVLGLSLAQTSVAQMHAFSNLWSVAAGDASLPFLNASDNLTRGMDYNPVTGHLLVVSRTESNAVHILDSSTGAELGTLPFDTSIIAGGTFVINMVGVTTDGVIYVGNLTTDTAAAGGPFRLYRWANETAQPTLAYSGDPAEGTTGTNFRRFGDSIAVRGTGANTQILLGGYTTLLGLLTTTDGVNFTSTKIMTDVTGQDTRWGLAWGEGNTFWAKQGTGNLKQLTLDLTTQTAKTTLSVALLNGNGGPLAVDLERKLIAVLQPSGTTDPANHKLRVFDISDPTAPVQTDGTKDMPAANANANSVGAVVLKDGKLFALETNNGIVGYSVHEVVYAPAILTHPVNITLWEKAKYAVTAGISGTKPLTYQWRFNGEDLAGATEATLLIPEVTLANAGAYSVTVQNSSGSATSNPGNLAVTPGNPSDQVTNIWSIEPNIRQYLTSGYKEYGVAINPVNNNVLVLTRQNPTNMLVVLDGLTGAEKHYIDYSGLLPLTGGYNKVDVADDGTVYLCNLSTDTGGSNPFHIDGLSDDGPVPAQAGRMLYSGDPGNGYTSPNVVWGGTMDVRGSGPNTQILLGSGSWNQSSRTVAILQADANGFFTSTAVTIPDAPDKFGRLGLTWGPGANTFFAKSAATSMVLVEFDLATQTGFVKKTYSLTGARSVPSSVTGVRYDSASKLLAGLLNGSPPSPVSVPVYDLTDVEAGPLWVDQELFTTYYADIEFQGNVDFAGGYLAALGVNNGLKMFKVNAAAPRLPVILAHPASATWFVSTSPTLTVVADSATPLSYQWYFDGAAISGATSSALTLTNVQPSQEGQYYVRVTNADGYRDSAPATLTLMPINNTAQMTNIWSVAAGTRPYLNTFYYEYGMAFNPVNSNLLVASYVATNTTPVIIAVMDALTGIDKHVLDVSAVYGGNRWINKIGVADDGVVYAANRTTAPATVPFTLYRWADDGASTGANIAYSGDPFGTMNPGKASGWTMDVRGAGVNTEILLSTAETNVLSILKTADGINFTPTEVLVANVPANFARLGISWGAGNTFWVKTWQGITYLVQYDLTAQTGTVLKTYDNSHLPLTATTLAYNDSLKLLATIARDDQKNVQIYSVADLEAGPQFRDQELFPTYNASVEANGALDFGGNTYLFALNENNGVMAFLIDSSYQPPAGSFEILETTAVAGVVTLSWEAQAGKSYQVMSAPSIDGPWQNLGQLVVATGTTASYQDNTGGATQRFYRVVAQ